MATTAKGLKSDVKVIKDENAEKYVFILYIDNQTQGKCCAAVRADDLLRSINFNNNSLSSSAANIAEQIKRPRNIRVPIPSNPTSQKCG